MSLHHVLDPYNNSEDGYEGWPFGGSLYKEELLRLIEQVPGVRYVQQLRLNQGEIRVDQEPPDRQNTTTDEAEHESQNTTARDEFLTAIHQWQLDLPVDTLLCSLTHKIKILEPEG